MNRNLKRHMMASLVLGLALAGVRAADGDSDRERLAAARDTLSKWVETQQVISKEKKDWELGKQVLEQRVSLLQGEIDALESRLQETRAQIGDAEDKRRELRREETQLSAAAEALALKIDALESKTHTLMRRLPDPILQRIEPLARRIPENPARTELSLSERFQNVIGVLNEVNKFNRDITVVSELRELSADRSAEVQTIYLGLAQAYYVSRNGEVAGVGRPTDDGWVWQPANELAPQVAEAIAILENKSVPAFVPLPVEVQ